MAPQDQPLNIHLVGSVPLADADTVFRTIAGALGDSMHRLPDGETGRRQLWIRHVRQILNRHPDLEKDPDVPPLPFTQWDGKVIHVIEPLRFKDGVDPERVVFETGYADDAIRNFAVFDRLQGDGVIPSGARYQICMATPHAIAAMGVSSAHRADFLRVYASHLIGEVGRIADTLPNERLAYQWDVCQEVLIWEGYCEQTPGYKAEIFAMLGRLGDAVPRPIELGYHLCYGSPADEHMIQPKDTAIMVEMTNGIAAAVGRPIEFFHLPVPKDRTDDAYFAPLRDLRLADGTALYLGLVHDGDDAANAARLATARAHAAVAGVGSECGWGRADPARLDGLIDAHRRIAGADPR